MRIRKLFIAISLSCFILSGIVFSERDGGAAAPSAAFAEATDQIEPAADSEPLAGTEPSAEAEPPGDVAATEETVSPEDAESGAKPTPSPAPTPAPVVNDDFIIDPVAGYDGLVPMGRWAPLYVTITNNGPDFDGLLGVNMFLSQTQYDRYEIPVTLASGATKRVTLPVKPLMRQDTFAYELVRDGRIIAEERRVYSRMVSPEAVIVGLLSEDFAALTYMNQRANGLNTLRGETWVGLPLRPDNFPETLDLMSSFSILVVDGVDPRMLNEAQQSALRDWLLAGGVVIVSGGAKAANGYPFFSEWTKLTPGALAKAEDITPALLAYMTLSGVPTGEDIWLSAMPENAAFLSQAGQGLIALDTAGSGVIFSTAFDLGGKPLSTWASMTALWPRALRQSASDVYTRLLNRANDNQYNNGAYNAQELIRTLRVTNDDSGVPAILLLALYLIAIGFGGYLLLKKLDRREWLWAAVPASTAVFALLMLLLSGNTQMNQPVALTASRVRLNAEGALVSTYIGVATPGSGEMTISTDQPQLPTVIHSEGYYYSYDDNTDKLFRPIDLRQRLRLGAKPNVGFASSDAWDARLLSLSSMSVDIGTVDARLWMEADGVHGKIVNGTEYLLEDIIILTNFGFVTPGDLLPGQTIEISMLTPDKPIDISASGFRYKPGVMYTVMDIDLGTANYNANDNLYSFMDAAIYKNDPDAYRDPHARRQRALTQLYEDIYYNNNSNGASYYLFAFNDALGKVAVQLNGTPVRRTAHAAVLCADMTFEPIGPTGKVFFHQGLIPAELIVDMGDDKKPRLPTDEDGDGEGGNQFLTKDTYINIAAPVAFRFVIPNHETFTIEKMTLSGSTYELMPTLYLYNNETESWDSQTLLSITKSGDWWAPYVDKDGTLYARYAPNDSGNRSAGMSMPVLSLKGEVK